MSKILQRLPPIVLSSEEEEALEALPEIDRDLEEEYQATTALVMRIYEDNMAEMVQARILRQAKDEVIHPAKVPSAVMFELAPERGKR